MAGEPTATAPPHPEAEAVKPTVPPATEAPRAKNWPFAPRAAPRYRALPQHRIVGTLLGATMWFWIMYRAKKDGPVLMGWKHPWDH